MVSCAKIQQLARKFPLTSYYLTLGLRDRCALLANLSARDIKARYKGSVIGMAWALLNPLLMLGIYTFVFTVVFKSRWPGINPEVANADYAVILFAGLLTHQFLAECINRAPSLIVANANYVKKIVFPLEVLPWVSTVSALFNALICVCLLFIAEMVLGQAPPVTFWLAPLVLLPLALMAIGASWFLASLGVYLRDIAHFSALLSMALLFVSGVFFPITALPAAIQDWLFLNPLAVVIEHLRMVTIYGKIPDLMQWLNLLAVGLAMAIGGLLWFNKTRRGFADVL